MNSGMNCVPMLRIHAPQTDLAVVQRCLLST